MLYVVFGLFYKKKKRITLCGASLDYIEAL